MAEAATHLHNRARHLHRSRRHAAARARTAFFRTPSATPTAGVEPGVDLAAALDGWGLDASEIQTLNASGVVS
ncbi:MAG: hypothetical protein R3E70_15915 [Burkholderiaceae bacterium]